MSYEQHLEEIDYRMGSACEAQNAFNLSRQEIGISDEREKAKELVNKGKYVILGSYPLWCPRTDGYLGEAHTIEEICDTREEAENILAEYGSDTGDYGFEIWPIIRKPEPVREIIEESEMPF